MLRGPGPGSPPNRADPPTASARTRGHVLGPQQAQRDGVRDAVTTDGTSAHVRPGPPRGTRRAREVGRARVDATRDGPASDEQGRHRDGALGGPEACDRTMGTRTGCLAATGCRGQQREDDRGDQDRSVEPERCTRRPTADATAWGGEGTVRPARPGSWRPRSRPTAPARDRPRRRHPRMACPRYRRRAHRHAPCGRTSECRSRLRLRRGAQDGEDDEQQRGQAIRISMHLSVASSCAMSSGMRAADVPRTPAASAPWTPAPSAGRHAPGRRCPATRPAAAPASIPRHGG